MKKRVVPLFCVLGLLLTLIGCQNAGAEKVKIKVLILPKFEAGQLSGGLPGRGSAVLRGLFAGWAGL